MRANTDVFVAIRNIGDSKDPGQTFQGTVTESFYWLIQRVAAISIAERIAIGMGRTESAALKAIQSTTRGGNLNKLDQDVIANVFAQFGIDDESEPQTAVQTGDDNWTPPTSWK